MLQRLYDNTILSLYISFMRQSGFNISCACVGTGSFYSCMGGREGRRVGILLYNICMENPSITFPDPDVFGPILLISPLSTICI